MQRLANQPFLNVKVDVCLQCIVANTCSAIAFRKNTLLRFKSYHYQCTHEIPQCNTVGNMKMRYPTVYIIPIMADSIFAMSFTTFDDIC